jgi:hypothetical protein
MKCLPKFLLLLAATALVTAAAADASYAGGPTKSSHAGSSSQTHGSPSHTHGSPSHTPTPEAHMASDDISRAFQHRGWVRGAGGDLYYNGEGQSTTHPHLHLRIDGRNFPVPEGGDIRGAVTMLAWSDGRQGQGGGGRTYIRDNRVIDSNWHKHQPSVAVVVDEFGWIMDYFANG